MYQGFINLNKPTGISSNKVLNFFKSYLNQEKIGFIGTLDPLASGVLPICIGFATRISNFLPEKEKEYIFEGIFGTGTDSYDSEGKIVAKSNFDHIGRDDLISLLEDLKFHYIQEAPIYSALKINGKKMYELARKGKKVIPKKREVKLFDFEIIDFEKPNFRIKILCGKGFYVRSLVNDIGRKLGSHAYLSSLVRTKSSGFSINTSYELDEVKHRSDIKKLITPIDEMLKDVATVNLNKNNSIKILNGNKLEMNVDKVKNNEKLILYNQDSSIISLGEYKDGFIIPLKVVQHD